VFLRFFSYPLLTRTIILTIQVALGAGLSSPPVAETAIAGQFFANISGKWLITSRPSD
jgi:hypothetical protein